MKNNMIYNLTYYLKYKDRKVLEFQVHKKTLKVLNKELLPISIQNMEENFDMIRVFCENRILMPNRVYRKEILNACGADTQDAISLCIKSKALSIRDCYWITPRTNIQKWDDVNLYENDFSKCIAKVALTGDLQDVRNEDAIGNKIFTAEVTNKGSRAKCICKGEQGVYLIKQEITSEINAEIISYYIAKLMGIHAAEYKQQSVFGRESSICKIETSNQRELIPCRDILIHCGQSGMSYNSDYYKYFMQADLVNFLKMQLFDCITLNTDRNRDNFGLLQQDGEIVSLYPLFDHDSCFKGKSADGIYFPTGMTFGNTIERIKQDFSEVFYQQIRKDVVNLKENLSKEFCLNYINEEQYVIMQKLIDMVVC